MTAYFITVDEVSRWRRFWNFGYTAYTGDPDLAWPHPNRPMLLGSAMTCWGAHRVIAKHRKRAVHPPTTLIHRED